MKPITATLTRDRHAHPLVTLNGGPFNGVDFYPAELRRMAQKLIAIADMANRLPIGGKHWKPTTVTLETKEIPKTVISDAAIEKNRTDRKQEQRDRLAKRVAADQAVANFEGALSTVFKGMFEIQKVES